MSGVIQKIRELATGDRMKAPTPREIVEQLDKYIVGQDQAKRSVAIAVRNRWRRQQLSEEMRSEVAPKNILMIGSTGAARLRRSAARFLDDLFRVFALPHPIEQLHQVGL